MDIRSNTKLYELLLTKYQLMPFNIADINNFIMQILINLTTRVSEYDCMNDFRCGHCGSYYESDCDVCGADKCAVAECKMIVVNHNLCTSHQKCPECQGFMGTITDFNSGIKQYTKVICVKCDPTFRDLMLYSN